MNKKINFILIVWFMCFQNNVRSILHNEVLQEDSTTTTDFPFSDGFLPTSSSTEKTSPTPETVTQESDLGTEQSGIKTQTSFVQGYVVNKAEMQSFEEWKEMKLKDKSLNKANAPIKSDAKETKNEILKRRKNHAGLDCGAKIVEKNQEANNPSHILTESKDDYMLNSCSNKVWFTIELCESIKIREIQIANYELFSNVPKQFRVFASERYIQSSGSNIWPSKYLIGTFEANNTRSLQAFSRKDSLEYTNDEKFEEFYAKYVKFEMISHYGNEHYCPLSVVRIYGASPNDDEDGDVDEIAPAVDDSTKNEKKTEKTTIFDSTSVLLTNLISVVVGKGFNFFSKLANLNVSKPSKITRINSDNDSFLINGKKNLDRNTILDTDMHRILCFTSSLGLRNCCQCFDDDDDDDELSDQKYENSSFNFYSNSKFCGYYYIMTTIVQTRSNTSLLSKYLSNIKTSKNHANIQKIQKNITQFSLNNIFYYISNEWLDNQTSYSFATKSSADKIQIEPVKKNSKKESSTLKNKTQATIKKIDENVSHDLTQMSNSTNVSMNAIESLNASNKSEEITASTSVPPVNGKDALSARLDYRIKMLELNMTLSSQYLEKLSQHYRKQMDEMQKAFNLTTSALIDTIRVADERDFKQNDKINFIEKKIEKMEQNLEELNKIINDVKTRVYLIIWTVFLVLSSVVLIELKRCFWKGRHKFKSENKDESGDSRKNGLNMEQLIEEKCKELLAKQEKQLKDQLESIENYLKSNKLICQSLEAETIKETTTQTVAAARVVSSTIAVVAAVSLAASNAQFNSVNQNNEI